MLGRMGKRKATPVLGLDVSSTTVKLLELSYSGDRYRVESYAVSSLPMDAVIEKNVNDVDGVANAIRGVIMQSRTKVKNVAAAVAESSVITKRIDMPEGLSSTGVRDFLFKNDTLDWEFLKRIRDMWPRTLIVKGVLHADDALEALLMDVLEDVVVVDLARVGLLAAGVVADLEVGDLGP